MEVTEVMEVIRMQGMLMVATTQIVMAMDMLPMVLCVVLQLEEVLVFSHINKYHWTNW